MTPSNHASRRVRRLTGDRQSCGEKRRSTTCLPDGRKRLEPLARDCAPPTRIERWYWAGKTESRLGDLIGEQIASVAGSTRHVRASRSGRQQKLPEPPGRPHPVEFGRRNDDARFLRAASGAVQATASCGPIAMKPLRTRSVSPSAGSLKRHGRRGDLRAAGERDCPQPWSEQRQKSRRAVVALQGRR